MTHVASAVRELLAGERVPVGPFFATIHPDDDFETYSEAGYVWEPPDTPGEWIWKDHKRTRKNEHMPRPGEWKWKPHFGKWGSLPGNSNQKRGLKAVGSRNYVQHPSFRVLSFAYDLKDGRGRRRWKPPEDLRPHLDYPFGQSPHPVDVLKHVAEGGILESWNVMFEWTVWNFYCVPVWGWPRLEVKQLRCAMAKAKASAYPAKLENACDVLELPAELKKDPDGDRLIKKLTVPKNPTIGNPALLWTPATAAEDFAKLYAYNEQDIRAEAACSQRVADLSPHELAVWQMDFRINARGMQLDLAAIENCIAIIEQAYERYHAELSELTGGAVKKSTEVAPLLRWLAGQGVHLYELDEETLEEALKQQYPKNVLRALKIRQILAFGSVRKLYAMRSHATASGRLHDQYEYYGAHTSLWNGRIVQPANLYKSERFNHPAQIELALSIIATRRLDAVESAYGDALEVVADCLRSMIIARPGCRLISADFTAIQAVVTSALAGEEWRLEVFRTHGLIYEAMASKLTGKPLQFYIDYKRENKRNHEDRQKWGKLPVLSGDFGAWIAGWKRFGADKVIGDDAAIKAAILRTRAAIPNVVEFWGGQTRNKFNKDARGNYAEEFPQLHGLEGAAISAVLEPGKAFGYRNVGYQVLDDILFCIPQSGGFIRYHAPRLERSRRDYASPWEMELSYEGWNTTAAKGAAGWHRMKLYGGVLCQNVVSHIAREVQARAMLRLEAHDYPVVMHTHDENVTEVEEHRGSIDEYTRLMRILPEFARDEFGRAWPINVPTAWQAYRNGKWEF